jgi:hypothetical protein
VALVDGRWVRYRIDIRSLCPNYKRLRPSVLCRLSQRKAIGICRRCLVLLLLEGDAPKKLDFFIDIVCKIPIMARASSPSSSSSSSGTPPPTISAPTKPKKSKTKTKGKASETGKNEGVDLNWAYAPPPDRECITEDDVDAAEFDWETIKNDDDLELWLIRVPDAVRVLNIPRRLDISQSLVMAMLLRSNPNTWRT